MLPSEASRRRESLSPDLVELLPDLFPDSTHVHRCGLGGADDSSIWQYALAGNFAVVSKDADLAEKAVREGPSPKFVWLRIGNCSVAQSEEILRRNAILIQHFSEYDDQVFMVVGNTPRT